MLSPVAWIDFADCHKSQSYTHIEQITEMVRSEMAVVKVAPKPSNSITLMIAELRRPYAVGAAPFPWPAPINGSFPAFSHFFPLYHSLDVPNAVKMWFEAFCRQVNMAVIGWCCVPTLCMERLVMLWII